MNPKIIEGAPIILAGLSFFGDPFASKDPWSEENEIGLLWQRMMSFMGQKGADLKRIISEEGVFYEVHIYHPDTKKTGEFEVYVGAEINQIGELPVEMVIKILPSTSYAVFSLEGKQIESDWPHMIYQDWMPQAGYRSAFPFSFQYYDRRFKGLDKLDESVIDVYVPIIKTPE
jgi:predicted transcriptional regulator YdeE